MTVQLIIKHFIVQTCGRMSCRTYTACNVQNVENIWGTANFFLQNCTRKLDNDCMALNSDSTISKIYALTKDYRDRTHLYDFVAKWILSCDHLEKWSLTWFFKGVTGFIKRAIPENCVCQKLTILQKFAVACFAQGWQAI